MQKYTGKNPIEVEVRNEQDAIVQFDNGVSMGEAARLLHGTHDWLGQVVRISCLLSTRESIEGIVDDREKGRSRLAELGAGSREGSKKNKSVSGAEQAAHALLIWKGFWLSLVMKCGKVEELQRECYGSQPLHI